MLSLRIVLLIAVAFMAALAVWCPIASPAREKSKADERAQKFVHDHVARLRPLELAGNLAWWSANTTGNPDYFAKKEAAQNRIDEALAEPKSFAELKAIKKARKRIDDPILARAIDVLYLIYLEKQVDTALLKKMVAAGLAPRLPLPRRAAGHGRVHRLGVSTDVHDPVA